MDYSSHCSFTLEDKGNIAHRVLEQVTEHRGPARGLAKLSRTLHNDRDPLSNQSKTSIHRCSSEDSMFIRIVSIEVANLDRIPIGILWQRRHT